MPKMIVIYVVCPNKKEAEKISKILLRKKLCACTNIIEKMSSFYIWPLKTNKIEKSIESVLLIKTLSDRFLKVSKEIEKIHSYEIPCIFEINLGRVNDKYFDWLNSQLEY